MGATTPQILGRFSRPEALRAQGWARIHRSYNTTTAFHKHLQQASVVQASLTSPVHSGTGSGRHLGGHAASIAHGPEMALPSISFKRSGLRCSHNPAGLGGLHIGGRCPRHPHPPAPPRAPHQALPHSNSRSSTLPCHASAEGPSSTGALNLYGSRTAIGRQLLQHLLQEAPPPSPATDIPTETHPGTPTPTPSGQPPGSGPTGLPDSGQHAATAEPPLEALEHVASLVHCVEGLMLAHRDMQQLHAAMERCAQLAAAGTGGGSGGMSSSSRFGGGSRGGFFGSSSSSRSQGTSRPASGIATEGRASSSSRSGSGSSGGITEVGPRPPWSWSAVQRVVAVGLGSLAAYREAIGSGRQTERESSRAAAR